MSEHLCHHVESPFDPHRFCCKWADKRGLAEWVPDSKGKFCNVSLWLNTEFQVSLDTLCSPSVASSSYWFSNIEVYSCPIYSVPGGTSRFNTGPSIYSDGHSGAYSAVVFPGDIREWSDSRASGIPVIMTYLWLLLLMFPQVDLFANKWNHQLSQYVSPCPDENAWAVDALTCPFPYGI